MPEDCEDRLHVNTRPKEEFATAMTSPDLNRNQKPRVLIIGAGAAGVLLAIRLQAQGYTDFTLYEKADEIGGTWRENRYPGVACDVPAHHYNYSFEHNPGWHHRLAQGGEIWEYFLRIARKYNIRSKVVFGHAVVGGRFDGRRWHIRTDKGREDSGEFLVAATGPLHIPAYPDIDQLDSFRGLAFHSARWPAGLDLRRQRVGVIGTGSSGTQIISTLAKQGIDLTVFMRTPQWVFPLSNRAYGPLERRLVRAVPWIGRTAGAFFKWFFEHVFAEAVIHPGWQRSFLSWASRQNLARIKDPELRRRLTPSDAPLCKRLVMSADFYPALQGSNVSLVQTPILRGHPDGILTADGVLHELDVLVLATGFWTRAYGRPLELTNEAGLTLTQTWKEHVGAHLSIHVPGFPNFMIVGGPRSPRGNFSAIAYSEAIVDHIVKCVDVAAQNGYVSIMAAEEAMRRFEADCRGKLSGTSWITGCRSWYLDDKGEPENWTGTPDEFRAVLKNIDLTQFVVRHQ